MADSFVSAFHSLPSPSGRGLPVLIGLGVAGVAALFVADSSYFTVGQNERAYVREFGRVQNVASGPIGRACTSSRRSSPRWTACRSPST